MDGSHGVPKLLYVRSLFLNHHSTVVRIRLSFFYHFKAPIHKPIFNLEGDFTI